MVNTFIKNFVPYFHAFELNTERCGVSLRIHCECGKMRNRKNPSTDTFHAVNSTFTQRHVIIAIFQLTLLLMKIRWFSKLNSESMKISKRFSAVVQVIVVPLTDTTWGVSELSNQCNIYRWYSAVLLIVKDKIHILLLRSFRSKLKIRIILFLMLFFFGEAAKVSSKSVWTNVFWYVKVHVFWKIYSIYTIYWDKTQTLKTFPSDKINVTKNALCLWALTHHSFTFNLRFSYELKRKVRLSKVCVGFSIFDSVSFLLKFIFLFNKKHGLFDFKAS